MTLTAPPAVEERVPDPPGFSVVIPTHQRCASLRRVLAGLAAQAYPPQLMDVLVISDGSTDGSAAMVRSQRYPFAVRVFEQTNQGPAAARNIGLLYARGPLVLFLDDDVVPTPCLLAEHVRAHGEACDRVVIGPLLAGPGRRSPWTRWETHTLEKQYRAMEEGLWAPTPRQFYTGNASVRLEHVRRVGGFDVSFRRAEDVELAFRLQDLGLRFVFHRAAAGLHIAERPFEAWLRMAYDYGRADVAMNRLWWQVKEFQERHRHTRRLVRWGLQHRRAMALLPVIGRVLARLALILRQPAVAHGVYSAIFNLSYWRGLSDGLGGYTRTLALLERRETVAPTASSGGQTAGTRP